MVARVGVSSRRAKQWLQMMMFSERQAISSWGCGQVFCFSVGSASASLVLSFVLFLRAVASAPPGLVAKLPLGGVAGAPPGGGISATREGGSAPLPLPASAAVATASGGARVGCLTAT